MWLVKTVKLNSTVIKKSPLNGTNMIWKGFYSNISGLTVRLIKGQEFYRDYWKKIHGNQMTFNPHNDKSDNVSFQSFVTDQGTCVYGSLIKGKAGEKFFIAFSISTLFTYWGIPGLLFFLLYGFVVLAFRKRQQQSNLATSRVIDSATTELTKTAIVVTVIFLIAFDWDIW